DLGGAKALPGDVGIDEDAAKLRGSRIHALLEFLPGLPEADWPGAAAYILPDAPGLAELLEEAAQVLKAAPLARLWEADALPEVGITADLPGLGRLHGVIDRLILKGDSALIVDFKSNATMPDTAATCPEGLLRQMGAYA